MTRKTRIVATLGPASDPPEVLRQLLRAGVDVARINFSHGSAGEQRERIDRLRQEARSLPRPVALLADLPGPKLRVSIAQSLTLAWLSWPAVPVKMRFALTGSLRPGVSRIDRTSLPACDSLVGRLKLYLAGRKP